MAKRPRQANRAGIPVLPLPYTRFGVLRNMACRLWSYECELEEVREFVGSTTGPHCKHPKENRTPCLIRTELYG